MSEIALTCPRCRSNQVVKNGRIHNAQQNFKCKTCYRQFIQNPTKKVIGQETRDLVDAFVVRETATRQESPELLGYRKQWLQTYVNAKYSSVPKTVEVWPKKTRVAK